MKKFTEEEQKNKKREYDKLRRAKLKKELSEYFKKHYQENREIKLKKYQEYKDKNPEKRKEQNRKAKTKQRSKYSDEEWYEREWARTIIGKYNITPIQYYKLLEIQQYKCAICGSKDPQRKSVLKFCVDHYNDENGNPVVRGLLCNKCNLGIGYLDHNIEFCVAASKYIKENKNGNQSLHGKEC